MAVVTAVGIGAPSRSGNAVRIHAAVVKALKAAQAQGETRPAVLRQVIRTALAAAKARFGPA